MQTVLQQRICQHFGVCGGCSSQKISYEEQLSLKEKNVREHLDDLPVENFQPILPSPEIFFYRNKMEYSFGDERDIEILNGVAASASGVHLGLHPKGRFALVTPTPECLLMSEESQVILSLVSAWATSNQIPVYVRKNGWGDLRHLVIREGKNTGERMVNLVARSETKNVDELAEILKTSGVPITTFMWTAHDGLSDAILGNIKEIFWGHGFVREQVGRVSLRVTPSSFMQTNTHAAERMIGILKGWADQERSSIPKRGRCIDLYCGSGAIGLNLADQFHELIGIELNGTAVADAKLNAVENGTLKATFLEGKAEDLFPTMQWGENTHDVLVVDPPRAGLHKKVVACILNSGIQHVYYVSCNPASLAHDLRQLTAKYRILDIQPMDFFPHTDHVETAVRMSLRSMGQSHDK